MRDKCLSISVNNDIIKMLQDQQLPDSEEYLNNIRRITSLYNLDNVEINPYQDGQLMRFNTSDYSWQKVDRDFDFGDDNRGFEFFFNYENSSYIRVSRNIFSIDGKQIIGVASVDVPLTAIYNVFYAFNPSNDYTSKLYLLDENKQILMPFNKHGELELDNVYSDLSQAEFKFSDDTLSVVKQFRYTGWYLAAKIKNRSLLSGFANTFNTILAIGILAEIIAVTLSWIITNKITKPVQNLSDDVLKEAQNRKYEHLSIPENVTDEIKGLYESYNILIDEVNTSIEDIQQISRKEQEYQFMLLQAQINPHFLYNTLNTISWMAQNNQNEDIEKMVVSLVTMFRNSLNSGKPFIHLSSEIEHVSSYLNIMQYRYPNRYTVEYNIQENTKDLYVTKQILQPLAENALNHGFLESEMVGKITINTYIDDGYLNIEMINSGAKIDLDLVNKLLSGDEELSSKHYGIRNVNNRLITYYGEECGLKYRVENGQTIVSMKLPLDKLEKDSL